MKRPRRDKDIRTNSGNCQIEKRRKAKRDKDLSTSDLEDGNTYRERFFKKKQQEKNSKSVSSSVGDSSSCFSKSHQRTYGD